MATETKKQISLAEEVIHGFSKYPKRISSLFLYDQAGDQLFQQIMKMPEYYLTDCEEEIFQFQKGAILEKMAVFDDSFNLLEFGAGDGKKTKILLNQLLKTGADFTYYPVDISDHILRELATNLQEEMPGLEVRPMNYEYFDAIRETSRLNSRRNITLFLGSNMGNFTYQQTGTFFSALARESKTGDLLLVGIDRRKNPKVILNAYNDSQGITAAFNLNLLRRMNRELGADFNLNRFEHYTFYEPESGEVRSHLVSLQKQEVYFERLGKSFHFYKNELIHTEISKKYYQGELEQLAENSGYRVLQHFTDKRHYFIDSLWEIA